MPHRVVIIGGGFAGLTAARALRRADVEITLLDRRNFHCFQPLLYQVATGGLSPANIAAPLRGILQKQKNCTTLLADVQRINPVKQIVYSNLDEHPYDSLLICTGASHAYFGHDEWEKYAPGLKTLEDAVAIRARVFLAFEKAEASTDPVERQRLLTFVVALSVGETCVEGVRRLLAMVKVPAVVIGGVRPEDLAEIRALGAAGVAVAGGILGGGDAEKAAQTFSDRLMA